MTDIGEAAEFTEEEVRLALVEWSGYVGEAAASLGTSESCIWGHVDTYPALAEFVGAEEERPRYGVPKSRRTKGVATTADDVPTAAEICASLRRHRGVPSRVAAELGYTTTSPIYRFIKTTPAIRRAYEESRTTLLDDAEGNVFDQVYHEDTDTKFRAAKFVLTTLGKERGYTQRSEIDSTTTMVHSIDEASTADLLTALKEAAAQNPGEITDAEFSELERGLEKYGVSDEVEVLVEAEVASASG